MRVLGLGDLPHHNADIDGEEELEPVARLREAIADADGGHMADAGTRAALGELVTLLAARAGAAEVVAT